MTATRRIQALGTAALAVAGLFLAGCRDKGYSQATPDAVLQTARLMVEQGDARLLPDLVYADSPQMREFLDGLGRTLDSLAALGRAVQQRFPDQVAALRSEAQTAANRGEATSYVSRVFGMADRAQRRAIRRDPALQREARALLDKVAMELMADPYAFITRNQDRLRTTTDGMPDGMAAIQWDINPGSDSESDWKPIPPFGFAMKQERARWYVVLPTNAPGVSRLWPRTPEQWEIMSYLLEAFDNALVDMRRDVESGRASDLREVAQMAGEKAFLPVALIMIAYGKALEEARKESRPAAQPPGAAPAAPAASPAEKR
jgi:hypothetical protein